jgi:hypothetical protein
MPYCPRRFVLTAVGLVFAQAQCLDARASVVGSDWLVAGDGAWHDPARWSTNPHYPQNGNPAGTEYDARITRAGATYQVFVENPTTVRTVTLGGDAVLKLQQSSTLTTSAVSIGDGARLRMGGGRLIGATITTSANGQLDCIGQGWLRDVNLDGQASLATPSAELIFEGGTRLGSNGVIRLSSSGAEVSAPPAGLIGSGQIEFDYGGDSQTSVRTESATLAIGSGITIRSAGGWGSVAGQQIVNNGQIVADATGGALFINAVLDNRGIINARNGAQISLPNTWTNHGTVSATDNGTLVVVNVPADADLGSFFVRGSRLVLTAPTTIDRVHQLDMTDSIVQVSRFELDNNGRVLPVRDGTNTWQLIGGGINGGSLVEGTPGQVLVTGGNATLSGVEVHADVQVIPGGQLSIGGRIAGRTIRMNAGPDPSSPFTGATVLLPSSDVLDPGSRIVFDGTVSTNLLRRSDRGRLHIPSGVSVVTGTAGGMLTASNAAIANDGYIGSLVSSRTVTLDADAVDNAGTTQADVGDIVAYGPILGQQGPGQRKPINFGNSGVLALGVGGDLNVTGSFLQSSSQAACQFAVGGYGDEGAGQLFASDNVMLAGSLEASLASGFEPALGDAFTIIRSGTGSVAGTFDDVHSPVWGNGLSFAVAYGAKQVDLVVVPEPTTGPWAALALVLVHGSGAAREQHAGPEQSKEADSCGMLLRGIRLFAALRGSVWDPFPLFISPHLKISDPIAPGWRIGVRADR